VQATVVVPKMASQDPLLLPLVALVASYAISS